MLKLRTQGGALESYFDGVVYDPSVDKFIAEDNRDLAPMLEAIFAAAPGNASGDQATFGILGRLSRNVVLFNFERGGGVAAILCLFNSKIL